MGSLISLIFNSPIGQSDYSRLILTNLQQEEYIVNQICQNDI